MNTLESSVGRSGVSSTVLLLIGCASLLILMIASLAIGRYPVPVAEVFRIALATWPFGTGDPADKSWVTVEIVRLPRILAVTLSGSGLALCGAAMQGVLRNPLVGPDTTGVSAGANFGIVLGILLGMPLWNMACLGFAFGLCALPIAFAVSRPLGRGGVLALVLSGFIVGAYFDSAIGLLQYLADPLNKLPTITYWLLGSFAGVDYSKLTILAAVTTVAGTALLALRWRINLLSLGDADARTLGVNVTLLRWTMIGLVAAIVAAQACVSGGITWVGLVVPHFARMLFGPEHSRLLPMSAVLGGGYLLLMDDIARSVGSDEIPIGLLTTFVGAPFFAYLLRKQQNRGWSHV